MLVYLHVGVLFLDGKRTFVKNSYRSKLFECWNNCFVSIGKTDFYIMSDANFFVDGELEPGTSSQRT